MKRNLAARLLTVAVLAVAGSASAEDLIVKYDQSQLLKLPRPAAEIIIGNPSIADVAIQSGNLLVVTGKSYGITNMIILDAERNVISDQRVMVERDVNKIVNLMRGAQRQSYNCTPQCNPAVVLGDDPTFMQSVTSAAEKKQAFSERSATDGSSGGGSQ
jgi:Flp pilus assembly secretin CpaC